jgi:acetyl-CoA synthetase
MSWFKGGKTNIAYNCLDRNVQLGRGDELAFIWEGNEPCAPHVL